MAPNILMSRNDGLGARLIPLLSALRLAQVTGATLRVHWPAQDRNAHVSAYRDLFAPAFCDRYFIGDDEADRRRLSRIPASRFQKLTVQQFIDRADPQADYFIEEVSGPATLADEDPAVVARQYRDAIGLIGFTAVVRTMMARIDAAFADRQVTAYHIRHGDVTSSYRARGNPWPNKYVPPEVYLEHMRQSSAGSDQPALLISDTPQSVDWLAARQAGVLRLRDLIALDGLTPLQVDFLELYAMSRASRIVAPEMSGFSRVAAAIGGVEIDDVIASLDEPAMTAAMTALHRRLDDDPDSFLNNGEIAQSALHLRRWLNRQEDPGDLSNLLDRQLQRGNTVPLIHRLRAEEAYRAGDAAALARVGEQARDAMIPLPHVLSEIDTMQALLHLDGGRGAAATPLLRRALYHWPIQAYMARAMREWLALDPRPDAQLYPFEDQMLDITSLSRGEPRSRVDLRCLVWDIRAFLSLPFRIPLVMGGADIDLRERLLALQSRDGIRGTATERSVRSFRCLVEIEGPDPDRALAELHELANDAPVAQNRWPAQRFAVALLQAKKPTRAGFWFARLAKAFPDVPVYAGFLGRKMFREEQDEQALALFQQVNPPGEIRYPIFVQRHAQLLDRSGQGDQGDRLCLDLLEQTGWDEAAMVTVLRRALKQNRPFPHLDRLARLTDEAGPYRATGAFLALLLDREGQRDQARRRARAAFEMGIVPEDLSGPLQALLADDRDEGPGP